jgi:hypothetical protein
VREIRVHVDGEHRIIYLAKFEEGSSCLPEENAGSVS